jgi:hypothetical protein
VKMILFPAFWCASQYFCIMLNKCLVHESVTKAHNTTQHNTIQYNTTQYNTTQHNTIKCLALNSSFVSWPRALSPPLFVQQRSLLEKP